MNRAEYFIELRRSLKKLPAEEVENAARYYADYFDEAGPENEQRVIEELGPPSKVASQILADHAIRNIEEAPQTAKHGISAVWLVLAAIFAAPIALPLAIAVFAVALALVVVAFAVIVSFFAVALALVVCGVFAVAMSVPCFAAHLPTGLLVLGAGLICAGLGLLFGLLTVYLSRAIFNGIALLINRWLLQRRGKKFEK